VESVTESSVGAWIGDDLAQRPDDGSVLSLAPSGYERYVRILHPVPTPFGGVVRWRDVAASTGEGVHPTVQWPAVGDGWNGSDPNLGVLPPPDGPALLQALAEHSTGGVFFALAVDTHVLDPAPSMHLGIDPDGRPFVSRPVPMTPLAELLVASPVLHHPRRSYHVLAGSIDDASSIPELLGASPLSLSPNLIWPADRSWCVTTDIELDSSLVGCSELAAKSILGRDDLEAFLVEPDDVVIPAG
jgi:hypothetical protein